MKKLVAGLVLIVVVFVLLGANGDVSGDVFVVTKGRHSIKIGLAQVFVVPESTMAHQASKLAGFLKECPTMEDLTNALVHQSIEDYEALEAKRKACKKEIFSDILRGRQPTARTDANGHFNVSASRREKIAIIVRASRTLPLGDVENYLWVVPVNLGWGFSTSVQLSNNNLVQVMGVKAALQPWKQ